MKLDNLSKADLAIVSNQAAIKVNQEWAGYAGDMLNFSHPDVLPINATQSNYSRLPANSVWWKPLPNNSAAVVLYASGGAATISFRLPELTWGGVPALGAGAHSCAAVDLWATPGSDAVASAKLGPVSGGLSALVPAGDVLFVRLSGCSHT